MEGWSSKDPTKASPFVAEGSELAGDSSLLISPTPIPTPMTCSQNHTTVSQALSKVELLQGTRRLGPVLTDLPHPLLKWPFPYLSCLQRLTGHPELPHHETIGTELQITTVGTPLSWSAGGPRDEGSPQLPADVDEDSCVFHLLEEILAAEPPGSRC